MRRQSVPQTQSFGYGIDDRSLRPWYMVVGLDPQVVGANLLLAKQDLRAMNPIVSNVVRANNETILQLHEMLIINGHIGAKILNGRGEHKRFKNNSNRCPPSLLG